MKKILLILFIFFGLIGSANAVFYGAYGSEVYDAYKTEKNITGAFGMKLGVIYNQDFIKPTILEPVILDSLDEKASFINQVYAGLIDSQNRLSKGNSVNGKNAPQYLTNFKLLVNQNKKSFRIFAFSNEIKKEDCLQYQLDFMKALDSKYNLIPSDNKFDDRDSDYPSSYWVRSLLDSENRYIYISCKERLEIEYKDLSLESEYKDYLNIEATKKVLEARDDYDI